MSENATHNNQEIYSRVLRAGRRTYFFDVRATKADDYYLTVTESKKHDGLNGESYYKKHKIYLYKEDFPRFREIMNEVMDFIIHEKGEDVISERHNPDFKQELLNGDAHKDPAADGIETKAAAEAPSSKTFTDVNFEEI